MRTGFAAPWWPSRPTPGAAEVGPERLRLQLRGAAFRVAAADKVEPAELDVWLRRDRRGPQPRSALRLLARGELRHADAAPIALCGEVYVALLPRPMAAWTLRSSDDAGWTLHGSTRPKWLVPIDSLTRLWLRLDNDRGAVALCLLRLDVRRDLVAALDGLLASPRGARGDA